MVKKDPRETALNAVRRAHQAIKDAEKEEVRAVAAARNVNVTWQEIAGAVEMHQPNAVRKYGPLLVEHRTVTVRSDEDMADTA